MPLFFYLVSLVLLLPSWAQSIARPAAYRVEFVDALPGGAFGYTTQDGRVLLAPACRANEEILAQCLVHEGLHVQGHGECLAYTAQLILALMTQSGESRKFAQDLYFAYGDIACELNDAQGYDKY